MSRNRRRFKFHFAISFAGEDRSLASTIASGLTRRGAIVFYDEYHKSELIGKRLSKEFSHIYGRDTLFFVPLISRYYPNKDFTNYEWSIAKSEEGKRQHEFILPIRLDDTALVGLPDDTAYLDLRKEPMDSVCETLIQKLRGTDFASLRALPTTWVATFGLAIEDLFEEWNLPPKVPTYYPNLCDWLQEDLERRLRKTQIEEFWVKDDSRNGETLSIRVAFTWRPAQKPLDFGSLEWWEVLEVLPFEEIYPEGRE